MGFSSTLFKWLFTLFGSILMFFQPVWIFFLIAFLALIGDSYTAFRLSSRMKKQNGTSTGKFRSSKGRKVFETMLKMSYLIVFAFFVDRYLISSEDFYAVKLVVGAFSFIQMWSILENESSQCDKKWAKILQRIMVDKAERHLDIELPELKAEIGQESAPQPPK